MTGTYFSLRPNEYYFRLQEAQHTLSNLDNVHTLVEEALNFTADALKHSPLSRGASNSCIELYVRNEVNYGRGRSQANLEWATEGIKQYVLGDVEMAGNSNSNAATIEGQGRMSKMDQYNLANGGDGNEVCTPDNPAGEANYVGGVEDIIAKAVEEENRPYGPYPIEK
ncbi:hypothetical protein M3D48_10340 [Dermabacter vaginalis]|uniref:hypothetical protein n=1 Tax=Dermabacter TaxID=36739 RepID=UPI000F8603C5|nr:MULTISPECIES: hypothetical protein [Dermabacter]MCT2150999.1 hypothetical protein [Dermabacter vaginalis]RUP85417.1 hypothetical protein D8M36_10020 [Dermabacter sp. HSID17554]